MRLLQNTSRGVGDLIMVYKRMTSLAGHTSRVSELLEQVRQQQQQDCKQQWLYSAPAAVRMPARGSSRAVPAFW